MSKAKRVRPRKIAIACQGGGSHAAFTAGVLQGLLERADYGESFVISALTGTCGGVVSAGVAWSWLLRPAGTDLALRSGVARAAEKARALEAAGHLRALWLDLECEDWGTGLASHAPYQLPRPIGPFEGLDALGNAAGVSAMRLAPGLEMASCRILSDTGRQRMRELYRRYLADLTDRPLDNPVLRVGATNLLQGYSEPLAVEQMDPGQVVDAFLASAAIPPLYGPFAFNGHYYWDGLFSHNPPVDCLTNLTGKLKDRFPEEIWVIQLNPTVCRKVPATMAELADRRNELTGNMALQVELYHIDAMNQLLKDKHLSPATRADLEKYGYRPIDLRVVCLPLEDLDLASKYERGRGHIERLLEVGRLSASRFFEPSSLWTCKAQGVHTASLVGVHGKAPRPSRLCQNAGCPGLLLCNMAPAVSEGLDFAQRRLELAPT